MLIKKNWVRGAWFLRKDGLLGFYAKIQTKSDNSKAKKEIKK